MEMSDFQIVGICPAEGVTPESEKQTHRVIRSHEVDIGYLFSDVGVVRRFRLTLIELNNDDDNSGKVV